MSELTARLRVYLAGPRHGVPLFNFPAFDTARAWLREQGFHVQCPAEQLRAAGFDPTRPPAGQGFDRHEATRKMLGVLATVRAAVFLPGWERAMNALTEYEVARALGLELATLDPDGLHWQSVRTMDLRVERARSSKAA